MAPTIPTIEPSSPVAGDSWKWNKTLGDFPAGDGWQLSYYLRGPVDVDLDWAAEVTANGDSFEIRVEEAVTATLTPGPYELHGRVTDGVDTYSVIQCALNVLPDPATAVNKASLAAQMVAALEEALVESATAGSSGIVRVAVNGRVTEFGTRDEVRRELASWQIRLELERNPDTRLSHAATMVGS